MDIICYNNECSIWCYGGTPCEVDVVGSCVILWGGALGWEGALWCGVWCTRESVRLPCWGTSWALLRSLRSLDVSFIFTVKRVSHIVRAEALPGYKHDPLGGRSGGLRCARRCQVWIPVAVRWARLGAARYGVTSDGLVKNDGLRKSEWGRKGGKGGGEGGVVTMNCGYCNTVKVSRELLIQQRNSLGNGLYLGGIWSLLWIIVWYFRFFLQYLRSVSILCFWNGGGSWLDRKLVGILIRSKSNIHP